ncbi:DUF2948 family protein [Pseudochrobactrum sp. MP213Fo]|uniref:DUF2948 family protein n=1 Tax=Pseudochrobactrum sp. MP213Fo TaxID=3022250 RepID=UPI003BA0EF0E
MRMLKLVALDEDDLQIISAHVQDAVLKVSDLDYRPQEQRFVLACNRFVWDQKPAQKRGRQNFERRRSVLHFDRVTNVRALNINRTNTDDVLALLAINFEPSDAPSGVIELVFAADKTIRLTVEVIEMRLVDLGPAWETGNKPDHITE